MSRLPRREDRQAPVEIGAAARALFPGARCRRARRGCRQVRPRRRDHRSSQWRPLVRRSPPADSSRGKPDSQTVGGDCSPGNSLRSPRGRVRQISRRDALERTKKKAREVRATLPPRQQGSPPYAGHDRSRNSAKMVQGGRQRARRSNRQASRHALHVRRAHRNGQGEEQADRRLRGRRLSLRRESASYRLDAAGPVR